MLSNLHRRVSIWWGDILYWNWKHKRRKRKQYMNKSYLWDGQDD